VCRNAMSTTVGGRDTPYQFDNASLVRPTEPTDDPPITTAERFWGELGLVARNRKSAAIFSAYPLRESGVGQLCRT